MGAGSSGVNSADFETLNTKVTNLSNTINDIKTKVSDVSKIAASAIDYNDLAVKITSNETLKYDLAKAISTNLNQTGNELAASIAKNEKVFQTLQDQLGNNVNLQTGIVKMISSPEYKTKFQGPPGIPGQPGSIDNIDSLKNSLVDKGLTMWCADGTVCNIPKGKKGIDLSNGASADGSNQGIIAFKGWTDKLDVV
ncbi:MAG: hypothetical protein EBU90_25755, partial [Proteobacteria bacterium]|nr:hypothetical protein [Pseudomonadota bacterium]